VHRAFVNMEWMEDGMPAGGDDVHGSANRRANCDAELRHRDASLAVPAGGRQGFAATKDVTVNLRSI
jgi:hypothetical protein